jgi:heat shock protein HtpX
VGIVESPEPNAYAAGLSPKSSVVVVTRGLLDMMNREELAGVIAHEIGHIRNRDVVISLIAAAFAFGFMVLLRWLLRWGLWFGTGRRRREGESSGLEFLIMVVGLVIAVVAAMLIRLAISRQREYLADATSAWLTRNPEALASALEKIGFYYRSGRPSRLAMAPEEMNHLFIEEPPRRSFWANLFATHPPIEERIQRLRRMTIY